ncbi:MAG: SMP-30/gluconolactonase/LRE family protein [Fimbriimonadaceae bacterium]
MLRLALWSGVASFTFSWHGGFTPFFHTSQERRAEITISDENVSPENLTSSKDGSIYFGSTTKGIIYRANPDSEKAEAWIKPEAGALTNVLGLLADDKSQTLWVCANPPFGRSADPKPPMELKAYDLKTGSAKATYPVPGEGAINDVAVAADGTVYVSDTFGSRILRLKVDAKEVDVWLSDAQLRGVDGLSLLADGSLYINNFFNGKLSRISVSSDGSAGPIVDLQTSVPFQRPDGLRTSGPNTLLQAEGNGRLTEITIVGDKAEVRVIREGLSNAAGVTQVGQSAFVLVGRTKAVRVQVKT